MTDDELRIIAHRIPRTTTRPSDGILGIIFLLVVLAQLLITVPTDHQVVLSVVSWIFWGVRRRVPIARVCCSVPGALLAQKLVAGYFSADAVFTFLPCVTVPAALKRRKIWLSALTGSSRITMRREVALEPGCLTGRCYRDHYSGCQSAPLFIY